MKLTVNEAIEQGYEYFVYPDDGYQRLKGLTEDIDFSKNPMLTEKKPSPPTALDKDEIADLLANQCADDWHELTGDDTDEVYDLIKSIDFSDVEKLIQEKLNSLNYYRQSTIQLIK